ncbi:MAG: nicotinate-nicotinamide nucleotide adenylyltransferase [Patescibacteria group bacterium]|jgi:nicotinate (nicotinamide) nucleotide adenylyltransferase
MLNPKSIIIGGSSANPPHYGHQAILADVLRGERKADYDLMIWIPCGERPDKHLAVCTKCADSSAGFCSDCINHRIAMTEMMVNDFRQMSSSPINFQVWYDDIFGRNTATIDWLELLVRKYPQAKLTWLTGSDSVIPRPEFGGLNEIQARWKRGEWLFACQRWHWLVYPRPGYELGDLPLPWQFKIASLNTGIDISSSQIRASIAGNCCDWEKSVPPNIAKYIKINGLYGYQI